MKPVSRIMNKTPHWLTLPWINGSEVFRRLSRSDKKSKYDYLRQKKNGTRPWKSEELDQLTTVRRRLLQELRNTRKEWISLPWINRSEVFRQLRDSKEKSKYDYLTQKVLGRKPWKPEELKKLKHLRKKLIAELNAG